MTLTLPAYRLAYTPIPKVACSSIKRAVYELMFGEPFSPSHLRVRLKGGRVHGVLPSLPFDAGAFAKLEGFWTFAVIRDPAERILSVWADKVAGGKTGPRLAVPAPRNPVRNAALKLREARHRRRNAGTVGDLPLEPSLDDFVLHLDAYRAGFQVIEHHTQPMAWHLGPDLAAYDAVYRLNEIDALQQALSERVGRPVTIPHVNASKAKLKPRLDQLSDEAFTALMDRLASDYALLSRYFDRPSRPAAA